MNILLLNQDWFKSDLQELGHEVVTASARNHCDVTIPGPLTPLEYIISNSPQNKKPDCIIIHDESSPIYISDLFDSNIPIIFYSVDTHHHDMCHIYTAKCCSRTFLAQSDYIPKFKEANVFAEWLPLWASRYYEPAEELKYESIFVGTMDVKLNPERVNFFNQLKKVAPIELAVGQYWDYFPYSNSIINQTVKGDLNFRVFEAMLSGRALLTERTNNGLFDLFTDEVDLLTYEKNNVVEAADKINYLSNNKQVAKKIGQAGREKILSAHLSKHRAEIINNAIYTAISATSKQSYFNQMPNIAWLVKRLRDHKEENVINALIFAMDRIRSGMRNKETIDENVAQYIIFCCIEADCYLKSNLGKQMVEALCEAYPENAMLKLAKIWNLLNSGSVAEANSIAQSISSVPIDEFYTKVNNFITSLVGL
jgi:hypothetical protein